MYYVIDPKAQTVTAVDASLSAHSIGEAIGFPTIDFDEINAQGDRLYFDERCFIRATPGAKRFQYKTLAPIEGVGVIVGAKSDALQPPSVTLETIQSAVKFLT